MSRARGDAVRQAAHPESQPTGLGVECAGVSFSYSEGSEPVPALHDVSFALLARGSLALLGASGAGKTTLLQVIRGLDEPDGGTVLLDGAGPGDPRYQGLRREVGLVFQIPEMQLFAATAFDDAAFGPRRLGWAEDAVAAAVEAALEMVGLPPAVYGGRHPYVLSGGEQRRLALAGVLAMRPRLLLLDEPFVSLDPGTRRDLVAILERLKGDGVTLVLATHDVDLAWELCNEVLVLTEGRVAAAGAWDFGAGAGRLLAANRLREPFLVELWRRLGRDPAAAPRSAAAAAEALT
jgi:energy-coupling factor transport system ATP-binding protein